MKKQQIEFDFSKWGQEGISVDDICGRLVIRLYENPIKDEFYGVAHDGSVFALPKQKFTMYQEVKPREIWVNEYYDFFGKGYHTKKEAMDRKASSCIRTIKFVEVIEDEQ